MCRPASEYGWQGGPVMTMSIPLGKFVIMAGERQLALNGSRRSQWMVEPLGRRVGYRVCSADIRWAVAVCASGLMSAHEYEAMRCPARSSASSPVAIPAQTSTTWRGLLGVLYGLMRVSDGSCGQGVVGEGIGGIGEVGGVQLGVGVRFERGRVGRFGGGVVGCRAEKGVGKSSMCWSGSAHRCRRAGTKIVCNLCMLSHFRRPALLATITKSTGHLAGGRLFGSVGASGEASAGVKRIWEGPRVARISMFAWARMSADLHGVSSHLGSMSRQRKGES